MKKIKFSALLLALAGCTLSLYAQMGLAIRLNRKNYMRYEQIFACVTLRNDTGKPLLFGSNPNLQGFVLFDIRDENNRPVPQRQDREIAVTGLYLAPGATKNMVIPLSRYYDLTTSGNYRVYAYVSHNMLPREFRSKDTTFRISDGLEAWKKKVGVPDVSGNRTPAPGNERTYSIKILNDGGYRSYYLQVEDPGHILAVTRIGNEVSYEKFHAEVDMLSRIHLLMPVAPRVYHYMSFNADGLNLASNYWKTTSTIPMLYRDPQTGTVTRVGGDPAIKGIDYRDPKEGRMSVSDLLEETPQNKPRLRRSETLVDLGENVMPQKAADEK